MARYLYQYHGALNGPRVTIRDHGGSVVASLYADYSLEEAAQLLRALEIMSADDVLLRARQCAGPTPREEKSAAARFSS